MPQHALRVAPRVASWAGRVFLLDGRALYVGPGADTERHAHHAVQLTIALEATVRMQAGDGAAQDYEAVLNAADAHHRMTAHVPVAVLYIAPESSAGRRCQELLGAEAVRRLDRVPAAALVARLSSPGTAAAPRRARRCATGSWSSTRRRRRCARPSIRGSSARSRCSKSPAAVDAPRRPRTWLVCRPANSVTCSPSRWACQSEHRALAAAVARGRGHRRRCQHHQRRARGRLRRLGAPVADLPPDVRHVAVVPHARQPFRSSAGRSASLAWRGWASPPNKCAGSSAAG